MSRRTFAKTAAEILDYGWDWSGWLPAGAIIASSLWLVDAGITVQAQSHDDTSTQVWLIVGTLGEKYRVVNRVTDSDGRTAERAFWIKIVEVRTE